MNLFGSKSKRAKRHYRKAHKWVEKQAHNLGLVAYTVM